MSLQPIDYYDREKLGLPPDRPLQQREYKAIDTIRRRLPDQSGVEIRDIGCGDGMFLQRLDAALDRPYNYHGVDYSEHEIKKAQALPYEFRRCNLEEGIPYDESTFDLVYSGEVIEHIYNPDFMLEECNRVLKPGGLLIISTPNLQAWYNRVLFLFGIQPLFYEVSTKSSHIGAGPMRHIRLQSVPVGHLRVFNRRGLLDLMQNQGFEVVGTTGTMFQSLPKPVQFVENIFSLRPSLASNLVVTARKPAATAASK